MSEKSIELAIRRYLKSIGAKVEKQHGTVFGHNGVPDLLGSYRGRALALEVKKPGKEPTPIQRKELREWKESLAITGVVTSVNEVKELLKGEKDVRKRNLSIDSRNAAVGGTEENHPGSAQRRDQGGQG